jgi:argininosuccinate lyase
MIAAAAPTPVAEPVTIATFLSAIAGPLGCAVEGANDTGDRAQSKPVGANFGYAIVSRLQAPAITRQLASPISGS